MLKNFSVVVNLSFKVRLASQTISGSVVTASDFLKETGLPQFAGCGPTVKFIRIMSCIFIHRVIYSNRYNSIICRAYYSVKMNDPG